MSSRVCSNCGRPLPDGAAFCGDCGARQPPAAVPAQNSYGLSPSARPGDTLQASKPPVEIRDVGAELRATTQPLSLYSGTDLDSSPADSFPPGAFVPPLGGWPGWPATWAPPQKPARKRVSSGSIIAIVVVIILLGGVLAFALYNGAKNSATTQGPGSTPTIGFGGGGGGPAGTQTLPAINRVGYYAGVKITLLNAVEAQSLPGFQPFDPKNYGLKIQARLENRTTTPVDVGSATHLVDANKNVIQPTPANVPDALPPYAGPDSDTTGTVYFEVAPGSLISTFALVLGRPNESLVMIPLAAPYDPTPYQQGSKTINKSVSYSSTGAAVTAEVTKILYAPWIPGYQADQGMRFLQVALVLTDTSSLSAYVGGTQFQVQDPTGKRVRQDDTHGLILNDSLDPGERKDEGFITFEIPASRGDYIFQVFNSDGTLAGQIDLGTL